MSLIVGVDLLKILAVDNSVMDKKQYEWIDNLIPQYHESIDVWTSCDSAPPQKIEQYDRIILLGSEASLLDDHKWLKPEIDLIQTTIEYGIPLLGICFGHQIIAHAVLGRDYVRRRSNPELGWPEIRLLKRNKLFQGISDRFFSYSFHFDEVVESSALEILARSDECNVQAYQLKNKEVWGVQFHPEIDIKAGTQILREAATIFGWKNVEEIITSAYDSQIGTKLLLNFIKEI